ncbi:HotDog domain-containing protein [Astrocystis sublimbata]|nr:HotDog domain-containing protein [Astrocystis sublimbata]
MGASIKEQQNGSDTLASLKQQFISRGISILQEPSTISFFPTCREPLPLASLDRGALISRDRFFRHMLYSEEAIPSLLGFYQDPFRDHAREFPQLPFIVTSITLVLDVHENLHGFNGTVHGGVICAIIDEAMGSLLTQNDNLNREAKAKGIIPKESQGFGAAATAEMNVKYLRPISTPSLILVTAESTRIEGRRLTMHVEVANKEGKKFATATGSFVMLSRANL